MIQAAIFVDYENIYISMGKKVRLTHEELMHFLHSVVCKKFRVPELRQFRIAYAPWSADNLEGAIEAVARYSFRTETVLSVGPGKNTVDAVMANDIRDILERPDCPETIVLATGDHFFNPTADAIHLKGKKCVIVGVRGSTNPGLIAKSDESPIFVDDEIKPKTKAPSVLTKPGYAGLSYPEVEKARVFVRMVDATRAIMKEKGLDPSRRPYLIFSDLRRGLTEKKVFPDEQEAATWINVAKAETVYRIEEVLHESGHGVVSRCFLNDHHPLVRGYRTVVAHLLECLKTATEDKNRSYASFKVWLDAVKNDASLSNDPDLKVVDDNALAFWRDFLVLEKAVFETEEQAPDGKAFKGYRLNRESPLVQEALGAVVEAGPSPIELADRVALSIDHMLEDGKRIGWLSDLPDDQRWLAIRTFLDHSPLAAEVGRDRLRAELSDSETFIVEEYENPRSIHKTTGVKLNLASSTVQEILEARDRFVLLLSELLGGRERVERGVLVSKLVESGTTFWPDQEAGNFWIGAMATERVVTVQEDTVELNMDHSTVKKLLTRVGRIS